ncbi:hypothetical protein NG895_14955 [Aeoliella sp. ICT_H6.2]|uniref:Uncharacterized protein n=1 Tax=Aeoliella straminimaris TaxID=2954799 RepID=A0A9X2JJN7_9BACT|nr:hypothetical protein [Aeoliella straminimaris]MCO6045209.1 hypothetical protein [Aeoliella straminimaris]
MRLLCSIRWLWNRLHPFTWVIVAVVSAALVLIVVPGEELHSLEDGKGDVTKVWNETWGGKESLRRNQVDSLLNGSGPALSVSLYEHGWPWPWFVRGVRTCENPRPGTTAPAPKPSKALFEFAAGEIMDSTTGLRLPVAVEWSNYDNWPLRTDASHLRGCALLGNILVIGGFLATIVVGTQRWVRQRGAFYRLRIIDLLALTAAIAVTFAWFEHHRQSHHIEREVQNYKARTHTLPFPSCLTFPSFWIAGEEYCGPVWLYRLAGNRQFLPQLNHYTYAAIGATSHWKNDIEQLKRLPYLEKLWLRTPVTAALLASLVDDLSLREVEVELARIDNHPYQFQVAADLGVDEDDLLNHENLEQLATLSVETLVVRADELVAEDLERLLAAGPQAKLLQLDGPAIEIEEFEDLRQRYPETRWKVRWLDFGSPSGYADQPSGDQDDHVAYARQTREEMKVLRAMKREQQKAQLAE